MFRRIYQSRKIRNLLSVRSSKSRRRSIAVNEDVIHLRDYSSVKKHEFNEYINSLAVIRPDLSVDYIRSILLDGDSYLARHPDVVEAGMDPVNHYFTFGFKENRELFLPRSVVKPAVFNVSKGLTLYFSSANLNDGSFKYRCLYQAMGGGENIVYNVSTPIDILVKGIFSSSRLIFSRPEDTKMSRYVICLAKNLGINVTLDYDDLLLAEFSKELGHVRSKGSKYDSARRNTFKKNAYLPFADEFICSTPLIADKLSTLNRPIHVRKNRLPIQYLGDFPKIKSRVDSQSGRRLRVLYLSGTATHKKDFSLINGVLLKLAQNFPDKFELTFLGNTGVNISPFSMYMKYIKVIPRVSFEGMLDVIAEHDLAVVPLEKTVFNMAKSNIKFIECGSQGVPVVASNVREFSSVIRHDENGWLCESESDWYFTLKSIIDNPEGIGKPSLQVFSDVKEQFMIGQVQ